MAKRQMASPPALPGFRYIRPIGAGGYADVFLYEQETPRRQVAVKVLDPTAIPAGAVADYTAEANLMAKVSAHPYIVQVFMASVAADGRQYLVMEYYPGDNFYDRAREEEISVAEALRVGVQLAAAVETAHRAGVLHRDIKPANVLTSEYRRPGLTDFGIASVQGPGADVAEGLSIPWSPPEAFGDQPTDARSDVYSLAATIYTLLAGRSPFEVKGADNRPLTLMTRIEHNPVPAIGRADVTPMLERTLAGAMAKSPAHRPASAAAFGRQLQAVESELHLAVTPLELAEDPGTVRTRRPQEVDDDSTRVKGVQQIQAQAPAVAPPVTSAPVDDRTLVRGQPTPRFDPVPGSQPGERRREGMLAEPDVADTIGGARVRDLELAPLAPPKRPPKVLYAALGVAAVLAGVLVGVFALGGDGGDDKDAGDRSADVAEVNDDIELTGVEPVHALDPSLISIERDAGGGFVIAWPDQGDGYTYAVTPDGAAGPQEVSVPAFVSDTECVEIQVIAPDGRMSASTATSACAG